MTQPSSNNQVTNNRIYTVSEITRDIKLILESAYNDIWVEGEVSNFQAHPSGHFYFTLKDGPAVLPAAMFRGANRELKFKIENGLKMLCFGRISVYEPQGKYQIIVQRLQPKGIGSLQLALEQLKEKLEKEGLFSQQHKRPIPYLPSTIGIVTALSGAAIKDMLKVLDRRFSGVRVIIRPALVQGEGAKEDIAQGIRELNSYNENAGLKERIEVMIVGRGGGSMEDLWAFNEEIVARAIYASGIPVISAVGHERDWTISDLVADMRAATPSVAAEQVIPKKEDLRLRVNELSLDLKRACLEKMRDFYELVESLQKKLKLLSPSSVIEQYSLKALDQARQIHLRMQHVIKIKEAGFNTLIEKLSSLSPLNILSRGYSITFKMPQAIVLKEARTVKNGDIIKTRLNKGEIVSRVMEEKENG